MFDCVLCGNGRLMIVSVFCSSAVVGFANDRKDIFVFSVVRLLEAIGSIMAFLTSYSQPVSV
jgi:hypothetical protein